VLAQYVKDLSFENPGSPDTLRPGQPAPGIDLAIDVKARAMGEDKLADRFDQFRMEELAHRDLAIEEGAKDAPGYRLPELVSEELIWHSGVN